MKVVRMSLAFSLLFVSITGLSAESFRVRSLTPVLVDSKKAEAVSVPLGYNDAIGITFPKEAPFLKGVEIEIKIPQDIIAYRNSMAYGVYRQVRPAPQTQSIDYQADRIDMQPLPARLTFVLQIPLRPDHGLKSGPYATVLPVVHDPRQGPLLFRLLPVMKGLPENIESLTFGVKIKPILANEGGFRLSVAYPDGHAKPITVRVDERLVEDTHSMLVLAPGNHHLSIVSQDFRNEVRMFTVEVAKITELSVALQGTSPRLLLEAPENAVITVDGIPVANPREPREFEPGEHTIQFTIGDYTITRQVFAERGKDYTVSMRIDVNVTESP